jgi:mono/diheme cytochrome c family protein
MVRRPFAFLLPAAVLLAAATITAGGWAVTTVDDLPDQIEAGKPVTLTYTVRQHGQHPLAGLRGGVEARLGTLNVRADARAGRKTGQYVATLTLPRAGDWELTIHSGFMNSHVTLLPVRAVPAGSAALAPLPKADRGERLFVAKGCVTCHGSQLAPPLVPNKYQADFLRQILVDPSTMPRSGKYTIEMPDLGLSQPEIAALVAFINDGARVTKVGGSR